MKIHLLVVILLFSCAVTAQTGLPKHLINVSGGYSKTGTGDLNGYILSAAYQQYLTKRISWSAGFGGTLHDGAEPVFYIHPYTGKLVDGSVRYTTGGLQGFGHAGYSLVRSGRHEIQLRAGVVVRLQSTSLFDVLSITPAQVSGLPMPVVDFINNSRQQTISGGYSAQVVYNFTVQQKTTFGFLAGFQNDTGGDVITQLAFSAGRRF